MQTTILGRTNLTVSRTAFGALPIQRVSFDQANTLLRKAYNHGINFFDTARGYSDSEEKIGEALADVRPQIIIATKSGAQTSQALLEQVRTSLKKLKTDYIDILQLHNPSWVPKPGGDDGLYHTLLDLQQKGVILHIGLTSHRLQLAFEAVQSGLYETVQFPLSSLSSEQDLELVHACKTHNVGLIAMKAMSGGLLTNASTTFAFLRQYENVVPIWGIQREAELDQFLALEADPPELDQQMWDEINKDRATLAGSFCRGCGYCLPCPANIPINMAARMSLLLTRTPMDNFLSASWQEQMERITNCSHCGNCKANCPYELDTPQLLQKELTFYRDFASKQA